MPCKAWKNARNSQRSSAFPACILYYTGSNSHSSKIENSTSRRRLPILGSEGAAASEAIRHLEGLVRHLLDELAMKSLPQWDCARANRQARSPPEVAPGTLSVSTSCHSRSNSISTCLVQHVTVPRRRNRARAHECLDWRGYPDPGNPGLTLGQAFPQNGGKTKPAA